MNTLVSLRLLAASGAGWLALAFGQEPVSDPDTLRVLPTRPAARKGDGPLRDHLRRESHVALALRRDAFEALKSPDPIAAYQRTQRARFLESFGEFPSRTPLNARVVGELRGDGFRVEKILFESQPGFVVSGLLYLPANGSGPHPVALMPCGHSANGKAGYQAAANLLARNGIAVVPLRQLEHTVHGALRAYDLPELRALAGRVEIAEAVDATGRRLPRP